MFLQEYQKYQRGVWSLFNLNLPSQKTVNTQNSVVLEIRRVNFYNLATQTFKKDNDLKC